MRRPTWRGRRADGLARLADSCSADVVSAKQSRSNNRKAADDMSTSDATSKKVLVQHHLNFKLAKFGKQQAQHRLAGPYPSDPTGEYIFSTARAWR